MIFNKLEDRKKKNKDQLKEKFEFTCHKLHETVETKFRNTEKRINKECKQQKMLNQEIKKKNYLS